MSFLLVHGLGGDRQQPLELVGPALPEHATVFAPDLRAHGQSPLLGGPGDFSLDAVAAEVAESIRSAELADEPITVIGISLGSAIALQLARAGSLPIDRLVLLRPAFTDLSLPAHLGVFPVIGELLHRHGAERGEELFRSSGVYRSILRHSRLGAAGVIEQFRKPDAQQRAIRLVEFPRNRSFAPGERLDTPPATIIAAPRDPVHPQAVAELWHYSLPGSTLVTVPARDDGIAAYVDATRRAVREAVQASPRD